MSRKFEARPQVNPQESRMMKKWKTRAALFVLSAMPLSGWADPVIQSITSNSQAGADVIRVEFNEPIGKVPTGFVVQTPPRIALDLPGVTSALDRNIVDVNAGNLRSVNVAKALDRTRLVLNLRHSAKYQAKIEGNTLLIIMDSTASTTPSSVATATPPVTASAPVAASGATAAASPPKCARGAFRRQPKCVTFGTQRHRFSPWRRCRWAHRGGFAQRPSRRRYQAARPCFGGRIPQIDAAREPASALGRD